MLFVIDGDPRELAAFERLLRRRFGADYGVMAGRPPEARLGRFLAENIGEAYDHNLILETVLPYAVIEVYECTATVLQPG